MRLEHIRLERFGHFESLNVAIGTSPNLLVLHGANEAGKTTLLHALRWLLFGIPVRHGYSFRFAYEEARLSATARDRAGRTLDVVRRKGRGKTLTGTRMGERGQEPVDDDTFRTYQGAITPALYESVFGFTQEDLRGGAAALQRAGLGEILAGVALGGSGTQLLQSIGELKEQREQLYKPRARERTAVHALLARIRETKRAVSEATLSGTAYAEVRGQEDTEKRRRHALDQTLDRLTSEQTHWTLLENAWPDFQEREQLRVRIEAQAPSEPCDAVTADRILAALRDIVNARSQLERIESEVASLEDAMKRQEFDPRLLDHSATVGALVMRVAAVQASRARVPALEHRVAADQTQLARDLEEFGVPQAAVTARENQPPRRTREQLEALVSTWHEARAESKKQQGAQEHARARALDAESNLRRLDATAPNLAVLPLISLLEPAELAHERVAQHERHHAQLSAQIATRHGQLRPRPGLDRPLESAVYPSLARVQELRAERDALEQRARNGRERLEFFRGELSLAQAQRDVLVQGGEPPTGAQLRAARERRNHGWSLIRRAWIARDDVGNERLAFDASKNLDEAYTQAVAEADQIADRLFSEASRVARVEEIQEKIAAEHSKFEAATQLCEQVALDLAVWRRTWTALWAPCGVDPAEPADMLTWLDAAATVRSLLEERRACEVELGVARLQLDEFETVARERLGNPDGSVSWLLAAVREQRDAARAREARHDEATRSLEQATSDLRRAEAGGERALEQTRALSLEIAQRLEQIGMSGDTEPQHALAHLARLDELSRRSHDVARAQSELGSLRSELAQFDASVLRVFEALGSPLEAAASEAAIEQLNEKIRLAHGLQSARSVNAEHLASAVVSLGRTRDAFKRADQQLAEWRSRYAARDEVALEQMARGAVERALLERQRDDLNLRLARRLGSGAARAKLEVQLAALTREQIAERCQRLKTELDAVHAERDEVNRALGEVEQKLRHCGGDGAAKAQTSYMTLRAELADVAEQYVIRSVAQRVLQRVMQRFVQEHQPALLKHTGDLFARITEGRYTRVLRPLDEDALRVETPSGIQRSPDALSAGTREQLFLAFRLAYIVDYCSRAEPLPVIIDDAFVNFDAARARATLAALGAVATHTQVLVLTCHDHIVELARAVHPEVRVIELAARADAGA